MGGRGQFSSSWGRALYLLLRLLLVLCLLGWILRLLSPLWLVLASTGLLGLIVLGNFVASSGVFGKVLIAGPTDRPHVALTFDDGPDPETTPLVLDVLEKYGARATFFVIGERAMRHPGLIRRLIDAGHQVENHSHRHSWATAFGPTPKLVREFGQAQAAIRDAGGKLPRYFRAPIGILSPPIVAAAQTLGLTIVGWTAKARDGWASTSVDAACRRLAGSLRPGAILLLHDAGEQLDATQAARPTIAPQVLAELLPMLAARGLSAVTLDELLA